ncbi:adenylate/guanylate cyclase [Planoprotostelium fungivorum]|uniref:Adenylate/guanylate cyclase n=1 Tax=Planoprotostelium fungivorum TaxID=1890364 RepID=A0A2P6NRD4_9EUKA|nr:adenylate/guanylate cyclase [Planoprotostelium fungivorum]
MLQRTTNITPTTASNGFVMTTPVVEFKPETKSIRCSNNSISSYGERRTQQRFLRQMLSVRCMSIVVAVLSVLVASTVIGSIAVTQQQRLQDSCSRAQFVEVMTMVKSQVKDLLTGPYKTVALMDNFFRKTNLTQLTGGNLNARDVYRENMDLMVSICASAQIGHVSAFFWPNGKVRDSHVEDELTIPSKAFGAESYHGQMDVWENTIVNSTYAPLVGWFINSNDNLDRAFARTPDLSYSWSALVYKNADEGNNCSSPAWWSHLRYFLEYDPPITLSCYNSVYCVDDSLVGYMHVCVEIQSVRDTLQNIVNGFNGNSMMYIIDDKTEAIIATSTGIFPYDSNTQTPITARTTNLSWIKDSFNTYRTSGSEFYSINSDGVDYLVSSQSNVTSHPDLDWILFIVSVKPRDNFVRNVVIIAVFTCLGAGLLIFITTYFVTRSLFLLSNELEKVSRLELDLNHLSEPPIWEAQKLYRSFIMMHAALSSFRKFVPVELISHIMKSRREAFPYLSPARATIYFQDIKDFTKLAESQDPDVLAAITEEYMESMTNIIIENGGMVDKYIGDCIMALFNLPKPQNGHEQAATRSAIECTEQLTLLNKRWKKLYNIELQHRVGINTGEVLAGNIGSSQRLAFTCIGDNVNLASRVEGANRFYNTTVLVTDTTYQQIDRDAFTTRKISTVRVAGKKRETIVYEVSGDRTQDYKDLCEEYEAALQLYDEKKLHEARARAEDLLERYGYDAPAMRLRERVMVALERDDMWATVEILDK